MSRSGRTAPPPTSRITPHASHHRADAGEAVLPNVREEGEFSVGHAPDAILPSTSRPCTGGAGLPTRAREQAVDVACRSGHVSRGAVRFPARPGAVGVGVAAAGVVAAGVVAVGAEGGTPARVVAGLPIVGDGGCRP